MLQDSIKDLKEILDKIDKSEYNAALENLDKKKYDKTLRVTQPVDERNKMDQKWKNLTKIAMKNDPNFVEPVLPFSDGYVLSEYNPVYKRIYDKEKYINE